MGTKWGTPAAERFFSKVDKTPTCWLWIAGTTRGGYGIFGTEDTRKTTTAHRWSYEHHIAPILTGLVIDHLCNVRNCVRPDHLEVVTYAENNRRAREARSNLFIDQERAS